MATLFESTSINGLTLRNRLVRSATWEGACDTEGRPTEKMISYYRDLARGGVGLIVSGYAFVALEGKQQTGKAGIHTDDFAADYRALTAAVHNEDGIVALQLVHAGGQANEARSGLPPVAPSAIETPLYGALPKSLDENEIDAVIRAFARGALRAKEWGFDAVQLHGAHGYLINQFLSPSTNRRDDAWGGSPANRRRFLMAVYEAVREAVGPDFPVMIKLNACDHLEGGLDENDALLAAMALDAAGIDAIEISSGTGASAEFSPTRKKIDAPEKEAYNLAAAKRFKDRLRCPVMVVGGFRSLETVRDAIECGEVDYVPMSRPFIREPALVSRWQSGDTAPSACVSCNRCFIPGQKGGIYCVRIPR